MNSLYGQISINDIQKYIAMIVVLKLIRVKITM